MPRRASATIAPEKSSRPARAAGRPRAAMKPGRSDVEQPRPGRPDRIEQLGGLRVRAPNASP
jgi:hypothetical protein